MKSLVFLLITFLMTTELLAQSRDQNFPTPIRTSEISGEIAARDIGDSRLTDHFYTFFAENGDLNLQIETTNFNGDVDLFAASNLRPLEKVTIYADSSLSTNRIVYFRQRQQIILRIEGRTPNDEPARYRISFSGSFVAATDLPATTEDQTPQVSKRKNSETTAKVNSAGSIVEVLSSNTNSRNADSPKREKDETPTATVAKETAKKTVKKAAPNNRRTVRPSNQSPNSTAKLKRKTDASQSVDEASDKTSDKTDEKTEAKAPNSKSSPKKSANPTVAARPQPRKAAQPRRRRSDATAKSATSEVLADALANVRLVITLKDKTTFERSINDVIHLNVDRGQITIVTKNGEIERFALSDVEKMIIE